MTRKTLAAALVLAALCAAQPVAAQQRPQGLQRYGDQPYGIAPRPPQAQRGVGQATPFRFYSGTHGLGLTPPAGATNARTAGPAQPPRLTAPPRPR